jgi:hypothetical protein
MFRIFTTVASLAPLAAASGPAASRSFSRQTIANMARGGAQEFERLSAPAPGSPFHYAFPVHNLEAAKDFYGNVLGCAEGRSSEKVRNVPAWTHD